MAFTNRTARLGSAITGSKIFYARTPAVLSTYRLSITQLMQNQIVQQQATSMCFKLLAAQRALYSHAKQILAAQLVLGVPVVVVIALVIVAMDKQWFGLPKADLAWLVGASSLLFVLLDLLVWNPLISRRRDLAARIQQRFDAEVLGIRWEETLYGALPDPEDIELWADTYTRGAGSLSDFNGWFRPEVAALPMDVARLVCQRANCWWDMDLRRRYNVAVYLSGVLVLASVVALALTLDFNSKTFFAYVIAPLLPFVSVGPKLILDNNDAIVRLQTMKLALESAWGRILNGTLSSDELVWISTCVQIGIYNHRRNSPLVFDWVHNRARKRNERASENATVALVNEYTRSRASVGAGAQ